MSVILTQQDALPQPIPFVSLTSLRTAHNQLLATHRQFGSTPSFLAWANAFIQQGRAIGALLDREEERAVAQSLLDYWTAILYRSGAEPPESALVEFDWNLAPELPDERCPYVGLDAFSEIEQSVFFGRERLVEEAVRMLTKGRLLAVVGPSGSGKSSLVLAGLLPALKEAALPDSVQWHNALRMVPGTEPMANLARVLYTLQLDPITDADTWAAQHAALLAQQPKRLPELIDQDDAAPLLLVVDQFEEVFTLCVDDAARNAFVSCLLALFQAPGRRHTLILTLRADFESPVSRLPDFQAHFERHIFRVTPLNAAELRASIEAPADLIGLKFEQGLVDTLLHDILGEPAALPLLQFTLLKLWEQRERNYITWDAYRRLGGGRLALANSADAFFDSLIPEQQVTARRILLRLVRAGDGLEITSNRVRLDSLYRAGEAAERVALVLEKLIDARLVRVTQSDVASDTQVEIAHEALVRNWPRLVAWLEEERESIRQRQRLTAAAEQWAALGRAEGALLPGTLLHEAGRFVEATGIELSSLEIEFLQASQQAIAAQHARELARQVELKQAQVEARLQAAKARRLRRLAFTLAALLFIPLLMAVVALRQRESLWQPLENFPRDSVSALATAWSGGASATSDLMICAGTSNIGIGCTQEGQTWNIYQQDLPTGDPANPNSEFPGTVRGVQAISIDDANPRRIAAFLWDGRLYLSDNGGVRWRLAGQGLPTDAGYVPGVAIQDNLALVIVGSELYGSHDSGERWTPLGRYSQPFWGRVHDIHIDAKNATAYAATDNGLYAASSKPPWRWQQVALLPNVRHIAQPAASNGELMLVAVGSGNQNIVYRWASEQSLQTLASFASPVHSLATDPAPSNDTAFYVLLDSGEVVAVSEQGEKHSLGRRPGWPWDQAFELLAVPTATGDGSLLLLGHTHGLLRFTASVSAPSEGGIDHARASPMKP
jgi:energy-coupling factor transporter ATP-binding protein EcfA2